MDVTILGTGAPLAPGRATMGMLVTAPGCEPLLLDTCGGFELARQVVAAGMPLADLRNVIVTHRHLDHSGGVPALLLANLPLAFYGSDDVQVGLDGLLAATYPEWPPQDGITRPVVAAGERREIGGFIVEFFAVEHRVPTLAVRVSHGGKTLAFSADSVPCDALIASARDADLFICDAICAARDGERWATHARRLMHPVAHEAATMATAAGAGALALVHIGRFADPANIHTEVAEGFAGPVSVPDDLARYSL